MTSADTIADDAAAVGAGEPRRSSIEKKPIMNPKAGADTAVNEPPAFERLPDEIIQQILQATDANGFASLALLNSKWRSVAQQAHLYAHHLAQCPSYSMSNRTPPRLSGDDDVDLPRLRRLFSREVKRNLFEAYLRPRKTVIKIVSNSISPSSCPGGEGIQFSPSPKGHHLLAYNSSRIHVIDLRTPDITVKREFKILRRPAATCINDEGTLLAVLQTEMEIDIYDLTQTPPKRTHSMILDHSPRAIALSPCGSILAAAYEGGIEVSSMSPNALPTDRRAVKCDAVDTLTFSFDGTQILGTTVHSSQPNTVVLTAPYYDPGAHVTGADISALWTTSILFPNTSRDCSHAVLIQDGKHGEAEWTLTYDRSFETFRAVRIDDLRNGTTYFTGPVPRPDSQARLLPSTLPAASYYGDLVSAGFQGKDIWLYGVPEDLAAVPAPVDATNSCNSSAESTPSMTGLVRRSSGPSVRSSNRVQDGSNEQARVPQWQILCDKTRNTFVGGLKVGELEGVSTVLFVADFADSCVKERLVVAARGAAPNAGATDEDGVDFVDGGRITILDFDYSIANGTVHEYTIEVGNKEEPEVLEEEHRDMDTEVAIVRRRTVAQKRQSRSAAVMRSVTSAARPPPLPTQSSSSDTAGNDDDDPLVPRRIGAPPSQRGQPAATTEEPETQSIEEQEALDAPYDHTSPRSGTTLRRAATAAANTRRIHPAAAAAAGHIVYRRADGRAEHPHESDADNWVPPPPPYQKEDPLDLPVFLRHTIMANGPLPPPPAQQPQPEQPAEPTQQDKRAIRNSSASMHHQQRRAQNPASANRFSSPAPPVPPLPSLANLPPVPPVPPLPPGVAGSTVPPVPPLPAVQAHTRSGSLPLASTTGIGEAARPSSRDSRYLDGENIYDVSPPESPAMRPVGGGSGDSQTTNQRNMPAPATSGSLVLPPSIDGSARDPSPIRLAASRTWPIQPPPINTSNNTVVAGYPYSAPPVHPGQSSSRSFRPPRAGHAQHHSDSSANSSRFDPSGGRFPLPGNVANEQQLLPQRRTSYQRPVSQQQHYSFPRPRRPQDNTSPSTTHSARGANSPAFPGDEEMPLIISTPTGVQGAFDPPDRRRDPADVRADIPLYSPVPRHPRPNTHAAILRAPGIPGDDEDGRPPQQRGRHTLLPTFPGMPPAGAAGPMGPPPAVVAPVSSSSSGGFLFARRAPSLNRKASASRAERSAAKNVADAKKKGWSGRSTKAKSVAGGSMFGGNRSGGSKRGKKSRNKKKAKSERDFDAASSAAWTDVTVGGYSLRSGFGRGQTSNSAAAGWMMGGAAAGPGGQQQQQQQGNVPGNGNGNEQVVLGLEQLRPKEKEKKASKSTSRSKPSSDSSAKAFTVNLGLNPSLRSASGPGENGLTGEQNAVIDGIREWAGTLQPNTHDAAVLLVSRSLATWLDNDAFLAHLIAAAELRRSRSLSPALLAAAVDQVPLYDPDRNTFAASEGLSVLRTFGAGLFLDASTSHGTKRSPTGAENGPPVLRFRLPTVSGPERTDLRRPSLDFPLANTLFSTGRPYTIYTSQWEPCPQGGLPVLSKKTDWASHQTTSLCLGATPHAVRSREISKSNSKLRVPLTPLTRPREIAQSLGNILSRIRAYEAPEPAPASEELERVIPELLDLRAAEGWQRVEGPLGVWALIIPAKRLPSGERIGPVAELPTLRRTNYSLKGEQTLATQTAMRMQRMLTMGCRLHRVLSGGGGWGSKRGLLSLDPETRLASKADDADDAEHDSLSSFLASLKGEASEDPKSNSSNTNTNGIASPGMYVQFLVEPPSPPSQPIQAISEIQPESSALNKLRGGLLTVLGTIPANFDDELGGTAAATAAVAAAAPEQPTKGLSHTPIATTPNVFGAVSSAGVYLSGVIGEYTKKKRIFATKLDAPGLRVISSVPPWRR
ncbi:hypothetical protein VTJ49DRAFT_5445 [Mycothermus thermophilus]|uniref:F-box domain-containing protein n=1 Tax=Humicola insolens TaxID=85995 RepID=A0ABR3VLW5_HUMIN